MNLRYPIKMVIWTSWSSPGACNSPPNIQSNWNTSNTIPLSSAPIVNLNRQHNTDSFLQSISVSKT